MSYEEEFTRDGDTWIQQTPLEPNPGIWPMRAALGRCRGFHVVDNADGLTIRFQSDDETAAYLAHVVGVLVDRDEAMALTLSGSGEDMFLCAVFRDREMMDEVMGDVLGLHSTEGERA